MVEEKVGRKKEKKRVEEEEDGRRNMFKRKVK